jgi:maltodextrin utilization protein YvdJ
MAAVVQTLGGVLYEADPTIPFMVMSAGMVVFIVWAFLRVREPVKMET